MRIPIVQTQPGTASHRGGKPAPEIVRYQQTDTHINRDHKAVEQIIVDAIIQSAMGDRIKKAADELKEPQSWISS